METFETVTHPPAWVPRLPPWGVAACLSGSGAHAHARATDGAPLDRSTGDPFRLVVPGWWGYKWVKFVERIDVVDYIYKGTWESSGYADVAIISTPSGGVDLVQYGLPLALLGVAAVAVGLYIAGRPRG